MTEVQRPQSGQRSGDTVSAPRNRTTQRFTRDDLANVRGWVCAAARSQDIGGPSLDNLLVAVSEIVSNAIRYAGGGGRVKIESVADGVLVEVRDDGPGLPDDLPTDRPDPTALGGRGLWMARQLCPGMEIASCSRGVTVRMFLSRSQPAM